MKAPRS